MPFLETASKNNNMRSEKNKQKCKKKMLLDTYGNLI